MGLTSPGMGDLDSGGPVLLVVPGVGVALCAVSDDRRFEVVASLDLHHRLEEVRGAHVRVHALLVGPPPESALLEQAARVRSQDVAVIDNDEAGFAHGSHHADGLVAHS